jgi:hypothetical protein
MNRARTFRLALKLCLGAAAASLPIASTGALLTACNDESDPGTWVKRLDDPAQRPSAIKRLSQFFDDTMTKTNKDRKDPALKGLLDQIVDPLAKQYTAGNLDDKTRKDLIKVLADMRDPRADPALAKAFNEYEPGKNDEDVKYAAQAVKGMAEAGTLSDQSLIDALWSCFAKFQASKAKSINLVTDLHDAVLAVKSPSYGPKCVERISVPVDPKIVEQNRDQIQFWQLTSIQVIKELKFTPAARPLVTLLLTQSKRDLFATASSALMSMPKEAEPLLIAALQGSDPDFAKLESGWDQKSWEMIIADALSALGRPAGRDAALAALAAADNDANRAALAMTLYRYPTDPRIVPAFLDAFRKIPDGADNALIGGNPHVPLVLEVPNFYDPPLTDWLLKEIATAKGDEKDATALNGLASAMKIMAPNQVAAVTAAVARDGTPRETEMLKHASQVVQKCGQDAGCYVKFLDETIPSSPPTADMGAVKAAYMAGVYGTAATKQALIDHIDKVKDANARQAIVEALLHLAPQGDLAAATALDKIVDADKASGNSTVLRGDDSVAKVALMLRARATP